MAGKRDQVSSCFSFIFGGKIVVAEETAAKAAKGASTTAGVALEKSKRVRNPRRNGALRVRLEGGGSVSQEAPLKD